MLASAPALTLAAISLQSGGTVAYSALLPELHPALFLLFSLLLTAAACLLRSRARMPVQGRTWLLAVNALTAVSFGGFYFALRHLPPAVVGSLDMGIAVLTSMTMEAGVHGRKVGRRSLVCGAGVAVACLVMGSTAMEHLAAHRDLGVGLLPLAACIASGIASGWGAAANKRMQLLGWSAPAVLAHRFHLSLILAGLWAYFEAPSAAPTAALASAQTGLLVGALGAACVLLPQLLLQRALSGARSSSVLAMMALQPAIAYGCSLLKPGSSWHAPTLVAAMLLSVSAAAELRYGATVRNGSEGGFPVDAMDDKPVLAESR